MQAKIREISGPIEKHYNLNQVHFGSGTTLTWQGTAHVSSHSFIIEWESPCSPLPLGYGVF
jgi:hypothetical protein